MILISELHRILLSKGEAKPCNKACTLKNAHRKKHMCNKNLYSIRLELI